MSNECFLAIMSHIKTCHLGSLFFACRCILAGKNHIPEELIFHAVSYSVTSIACTVNFITIKYMVDYLPEDAKT